MRILLAVACLLMLAACERKEEAKPTNAEASGAASNSAKPQQLKVEAVGTMRAPVDSLTAPAKVEANPGALSKVALSMPGRVVQVLVGIGDFVRKGTPVLYLDSPDTGTAVSNYRQAVAKVVQGKSGVVKAEADLARVQDLLSHGAVAEKDVLSARALLTLAQSDLAQANAAEEETRTKLKVFGIDAANGSTNRIVLTAPVSGKVLELSVVAGEYRSDTSAPVMTIADLSTVFLTADVPESSIRMVRTGQQVQMKLDAYPLETFNGRVYRIGDTVDPATRTIRVRAIVNNSGEKLRPEMFGELQISGAIQDVMSVPSEAVVHTAAETMVYRESAPGKFSPAAVKLGPQIGNQVAVLSGLSKSDRVVTDGVMLLRMGAQ